MVVHSNDPKTPQLRLTVTGNVTVAAAFEQPFLNLGQLERGATIERVVGLQIAEPEGFKILELNSSDKNVLSAEVIEGKDGKPAVKVTLRVPDAAGRVNAMLTAITNLDSHKSLPLRVMGQVQ